MRFSRQRRTILGMALVAAVLVPVLSSSSGAETFCNTTPITFTPPPSPTMAVQAYQPYPSNITVSGVTGTVSDVNVTLNGFSFVRPEDVDVLLVAPDGTTNLVVMSDIGGDNLFPGEPANNVTLTFDDEAANFAPTDSVLSSGTFKPTDDDDDTGDGEFVQNHVDQFLDPAPAPSTATTLSAFDGLTPNGTWSLYIVDDQPGPPMQNGTFAGGWCIDVTGAAAVTTSTSSSTSTSTSTSSTSTSSTSTSSTSTSSTSTSSTSTSSTSTSSPTSTSTSSTSSTVSSTTSTTAPSTTAVPTQTCAGLTATIVGTSGNDTIVGTSGPDVIAAGSGDDNVSGVGGNDTICGEDGNDTLNGDSGDDLVRGGSGNDSINGGGGNDELSGGTGDDSIAANDGDDRAVGNEGSDTIGGGSGNDFLGGGDDNDFLNGGVGDDHVEGNAGDDRVVGNVGNDTLEGNKGADILNAFDTGPYVDTLAGGPDPDRCFSDAADVPPNLNNVDC